MGRPQHKNAQMVVTLLLALWATGNGAGIGFSEQAAMVFEADYFTSTSEPSLQLECVGGDGCDRHRVQRVECKQNLSYGTPVSVDGCSPEVCGNWFCVAEGLDRGLRLQDARIVCSWQEEGVIARGSCALQHSISSEADTSGVERDEPKTPEKQSGEERSELPLPNSPQASPILESAEQFVAANLSGSGTIGTREVMALVFATLGTVAFCVLSCKTRWNRQLSTQIITPEERKDVAKLFAEIDTDGSGGLDIDEMKVALTNLGFRGLTDQQLNALMNEADLDGNGQIEEEELVALLCRYKTSGKVDFRSTMQHVLTRDMQHFRRNWVDEAYQFSSLVLIMAIMMAVLFKIGDFAERGRAKS